MRTTAIFALCAIATLAACSKPAPAPAPAPEAVSVEPTYTGKYK